MFSEKYERKGWRVPVGFQRKWPDAEIEKAPVWVSVDLRDGNQALPKPMRAESKMRMMRVLADLGIREIEAGFPAASEEERRFAKMLTEGGCPKGVIPGFLSQARPEMIRDTVAAGKGLKEATIHFYLASDYRFLEDVLRIDARKAEKMVRDAARTAKEATDEMPETKWRLEFSPEHFSTSDPAFARALCEIAAEEWRSSPERRLIANLPTTIEACSPNRFADMIEFFISGLSKRDNFIVGVHTHNDRGTGNASTEAAILAGAERVEGCLFGNGERTGNADLVALALTMTSDGVESGLRFDDLPSIRDFYERETGMRVHERHPYAGELAFAAFSGSHQDAIRKTMGVSSDERKWRVPYLTLDPKDVGRRYEEVVRINSQSGKGGAAAVAESLTGARLGEAEARELGSKVQRRAEETGREVPGEEVVRMAREILRGEAS